MSFTTIIIWGAAGIAFLLLWLIDDAFDKLFDGLFRILGMRSGCGPLATEAMMDNGSLVIVLKNQGKHKIMLASIEGRDGNMKRQFPTPYLNRDDISIPSSEEMARKNFAKTSIPPGQSIAVKLNRAELVSLDCQTLVILDTEGQTWPVNGFHLDDVQSSLTKQGRAPVSEEM
jgi:hypothetical protein